MVDIMAGDGVQRAPRRFSPYFCGFPFSRH
jgi:hypothetical protein